ncbi:MAG: hypothetical protein R3D84_12080 [Paracoccaceae bacterium]
MTVSRAATAVLAAGLLALAGCANFGSGIGSLGFGKRTQPSEVLPFQAKLSKGEDPLDIQVAVDAPGATVEDVRESVRFEATRYCLTTTGITDADWQIDPGTGDWAFVRDEGGAMVFAARCLR